MFERGLGNCREKGDNKGVRYKREGRKLLKSEWTPHMYEIVKDKRIKFKGDCIIFSSIF